MRIPIGFKPSLTNCTFNSTVKDEEIRMDRTNANEFRAHLKEWMDSARKEPIKITRKSGESFVLMNAEEFESLQVELANLRGLAQGLSDSLHGKMKESSPSSTTKVLERAKAKVLGGKKSKKAVE
jgi:prevent-host-death family protein